MSEENNRNDIELLKAVMTDFGNGTYTRADADAFEDKELADVYNNMLNKVLSRNNQYLARINDAQIKIGDTSCLKNMFELIVAQEDVLKFLHSANTTQDEDDVDATLKNKNVEFLALSEQISNAYEYFKEDSISVSKDLDELLTLDILNSDPAFANVKERIKKIRSTFDTNATRFDSMSRRLETMAENTRRVHQILVTKSNLNEKLISSIKGLTEGYKSLSAECLDTGRHFYKISRDIDTCRNDMFRHNSEPTLHDRLKIYEVDHVTLAWRLYNNIVEFESLRLTQVNNPSGCKFGIWAENMNDPLFLESEAFKKAVALHKEFHRVSVECYEAKHAYDIKAAMAKFNDVLGILSNFRTAFEELHDYLNEKGFTAETDVWKYRR